MLLPQEVKARWGRRGGRWAGEVKGGVEESATG